MARNGKGADRKEARAPEPAAQDMILSRGRGGDGEPARVQRRRWRKRVWTEKRKAEFLEALKETCNVREACRVVGMGKQGVYDLRKREPGFAEAWREAIEQGYVELEMLLLRQAIFGSETTETVDDGQEDGRRRTKTVHSYPHAVALRLLLAHRDTVTAYRQQQGIEQMDSGAVRAEIQRRLALMRERAADDEADGEGASGPETGERGA